MSLIQQGINLIKNQVLAREKVSAVYRRGESMSVDLDLTLGQSEYQAYDDEGNLVTEVTDATFICDTSLLVYQSEEITPQSGDRISITNAAGTKVSIYEVMRTGSRRPYSRDPSGQITRIHTKWISTTPVEAEA